MKKLLTMLLCLSMVLGLFPVTAYAAPEWPTLSGIQAEGAIVMDADSGAVIFGQKSQIQFFPASITKVMTALIVLENCDDLDDIVTFSHDAVYNVESGSSNMGMDEGDQLTVRDCLYGLMLASANEAANALAEHLSGSREVFVELMNKKATELGCKNTNFANPSGLNDPNHLTTAYDMALICREAIKNEEFLKIDGTLSYPIPPTKRYPEGSKIYAHHKMLKDWESVYYPGIFGGKTGYTSKAGNTLVSFAEKNGMTLIAVVLNSGKTHYSDTKALFDFGFNNFQNIKITDYDTTYSSIENDMTIAGLPAGDMSGIYLEKNRTITLPKDAEFSDATPALTYELTQNDPVDALAKIQYSYGDRPIGTTYLMSEVGQKKNSPLLSAAAPSIETTSPAEPEQSQPSKAVPKVNDKKPFKIPSVVWITSVIVLALAAIIGGIVVFKIHSDRKELKEQQLRRERRQRRLQDIGLSSDEFESLLEQKRSSYTTTKSNRKKDLFGR